MAARVFPLVAALLGGPSALAQVAEEVEPDAAPVPPVPNRVAIIEDRVIERQIYSNNSSAASTRTKSELLLRLQIEDLDRVCSLTDSQNKKLKLAGQGELKEFFDEVDAKILEMKRAASDRQQPRMVSAKIQALRVRLKKGFFGTDSFYQKTVKTVLNAEQNSKLELDVQNRNTHAFQAWLELIVGGLDKTVGFYGEQRERFLEILRDEIAVANIGPLAAGSYVKYAYFVHCMAQIPDAKLMPIFDDWQWSILSSLFNRYRNKEMEEYLQNDGCTLPQPKVAPKPLNRIPQNKEAGVQ